MLWLGNKEKHFYHTLLAEYLIRKRGVLRNHQIKRHILRSDQHDLVNVQEDMRVHDGTHIYSFDFVMF